MQILRGENGRICQICMKLREKDKEHSAKEETRRMTSGTTDIEKKIPHSTGERGKASVG